MTATVFVNVKGSDCRRPVTRIGESLEYANKDLDKADKHLSNAKYQSNGNARSTINSLKTNNNYDIDDFYSFADSLEQFVDKLIQTDTERAHSIRNSGQSHRKQNGLPRSLAAASINASFNKMKDIVVDATLDLVNWAADAVDWVCDKISDISDWLEEHKTISQLLDAGVNALIAAAALYFLPASAVLACIFSTAAVITLGTSMDKLLGSQLEILMGNEMKEKYSYLEDGTTATQKIVKILKYEAMDKLPKYVQNMPGFKQVKKFLDNYDKGYKYVDSISSGIASLGLAGQLKYLDKLGAPKKVLSAGATVIKIDNTHDVVTNVGDYITTADKIIDGDISGVREDLKDKVDDWIVDRIIGMV